MIKIPKLNLFVGDHFDYIKNKKEMSNNDEWFIISAAKEPYHRDLLGYKTKGAPTDHVNYLYGTEDNRLVLNLVDSEKVEFIPRTIIEVAVNYAVYYLQEDKNVFIHCNQGRSRSMSIAFFVFKKLNSDFCKLDCEEAIEHFNVITNNSFFPNIGMNIFIKNNYDGFSYIDKGE